ncbi:pyruvate formate lyase activating enzyme [Clostridium cavendishii DSM 21758]|uniref:Pyruvate formate-lyase-activating enzyme n=1 Tax=Clostridium cavendishii DSM 21758 TaxID=1121302 RepID=A0A1M6F4E0_9CLOT|nr:pyruvate formate-lyase-activating protein [Clostridium cavendishii]SHI92469.1 pyruvate formate lyase activating enzyme [Clostridium cavendishii DSM 21758]
MIKGRIHSIESMGLVDGPGIRFIVFMQGCNLNCAFCHNIDSLNHKGGKEYTKEELIKMILRYKPYFKSNGGVTFSGGEPLLQWEFLIDILKLCKEHNIHTVLDTSGVGVGHYDEILEYVDLVLLDIKHVTAEGYKKVTLKTMDKFNEFLEVLQRKNTPIWIRQVVTPGLTDSDKYMDELYEFLKGIKNIEKIEFLPYHVLGVSKYETMNIKYRLEGVPPMDKEKTKLLEKAIRKKLNLE